MLGRQAGRADGLHRGVGQRLAAGATQPNRIVFFADRQAAQFWLSSGCGRVTPGDGFVAAFEVARPYPVQAGPDIDINPGAQKGQRLGHILLSQQIDHLPGNGQWGCIDVFGFEQGRAHVDRNHDVGLAQLLHLGDRHVIDQAAVHQAESFVFHRHHQAGHRHGGAHQGGQIAAAPDPCLTGHDIGCHQRQWQGLAFHALRRGVGAHQPVNEEFDFLPAQYSGGKLQRAIFDAALAAGDVALRKALEPRREVGVAGAVAEHVAPVGLPQRGLHVGGRQARTEGASDQPAHTGAGYAVHRYPQLLQLFQHPHMRRATGATAP